MANKNHHREQKSSDLSKQELAFVAAYVIDRNAYRAYLKTFGDQTLDGKKRTPSSVRGMASHLLAKPSIRKEIRAIEAHIRRESRVTPTRVLQELAAIGFSDVGNYFHFDVDGLPQPKLGREIPRLARKAIASIRHHERTYTQSDGTAVTETIITYKLYPKVPALMGLCKHLGLTPEENQLSAFLMALPDDLREQVRGYLLAAFNKRKGQRPPMELDPIHEVNVSDEPE